MSCSSGPNLITNGLVLHVDPADIKSYLGSGSIINDISDNHFSGNLSGGGISFSSNNNGILQFTGVSRSLTFSNTPLIDTLTGTNKFTFSAIIKLNEYPASGIYATTGILMKGSYDQSYGLNVLYSNPINGYWTVANIYYGLRNYTGTAGVTPGYGAAAILSNTNLVIGNWYKIDMVHSFIGTTHTLNLYINGVLDKTYSDTNSTYPINIQNSDPLGIGSGYILGGNYIASNLDISCCSIYNRALSEAEVVQNFNALRGRFGI